MEKVTMNDIAEALNISRVTVSRAFNNQTGVSEILKEQIFTKAGEMGYTKLPYQFVEPSVQKQHTVSLIVSRPDSTLFWTNIIHRMAQELLKYNINLLYTYVPSIYTRDFMLPSILLNGSVDGIITVNVYAPEILEMVNYLPVTKIFLYTVPSLSEQKLTGDLILIEGYQTEWNITQILIQEGHRNIGFLGDINYARTNAERYRGYCDCMQKHSLPIRPEYCLTKAINVFSYGQELRAFLDSLTIWPTAFVCVSDYVAHFVQSYIDEKSKQLLSPVVLTGFDNTGEFTNVAGRIITANVSTELLGRRLALQLLFRTQHPDAPYELTFITPSVVRFP